MKALPARALALGLVVLLFAPPSLAGTLKGKVIFAGPVPPAKKLDVTIDQYVCGNAKDAEDLLLSPQKELRNAVVWLENPPSNAPLPTSTQKVEMDQNKCVFVPHIVLIPAGGTVEFLNSDRLLHNIHTTPKVNPSINRTQPKDRTIPFTFDKPDIVRINRDLHSWMQAWVVVAAHSYYAITGADGQFTFDNLPPGDYKLQVWHERLGTMPVSVTVADRQAAQINIQMKAP